MICPPALDRGLREPYLSDHLTGATPGRARIRPRARVCPDLSTRAEVRQLASDLEERRLFDRSPVSWLLDVEVVRTRHNSRRAQTFARR